MGVYEFKCGYCKNLDERYITTENYDYLKCGQFCKKCVSQEPMTRFFGNQTMRFVAPVIEFLDIGKNRIINSKHEIREIEKREGKTFGGHEELKQEGEHNKKTRTAEIKAESKKRTKKNIVDMYRKWNGYA